MPFRTKKQRAWMFKNKPVLAKKWAKKYGGKVRGVNKSRTRKRKGVAKRRRTSRRRRR